MHTLGRRAGYIRIPHLNRRRGTVVPWCVRASASSRALDLSSFLAEVAAGSHSSSCSEQHGLARQLTGRVVTAQIGAAAISCSSARLCAARCRRGVNAHLLTIEDNCVAGSSARIIIAVQVYGCAGIRVGRQAGLSNSCSATSTHVSCLAGTSAVGTLGISIAVVASTSARIPDGSTAVHIGRQARLSSDAQTSDRNHTVMDTGASTRALSTGLEDEVAASVVDRAILARNRERRTCA